MATRILIMRHGDRYHDHLDPELTALGFAQAHAVVGVLTRTHIDAIFCSPFVRALQTAAPIAQALGLRMRVDYGLCELLAKDWLYADNPLPALKLASGAALNGVPSHLIDSSYASPVPEWPDHEGAAVPGDEQQRARCMARHGAALERVLAAAGAGARTILIVGHGASHDYIPAALAPSTHPRERQCPACVDHVSLTTLLRDTASPDDTAGPDGWRTVGWGDGIKAVAHEAPVKLSRAWLRRFRWSKHADSAAVGEEWSVDTHGRQTVRGLRTILVFSPYTFVQECDGHCYYLDPATQRVTVWDGSASPQYEAEPA